jgi:hypothetical protein
VGEERKRMLLKFSHITRERERQRQRQREAAGIVIILCLCVVLQKREGIGVGEVCDQFHFVCCVARDEEFVGVDE